MALKMRLRSEETITLEYLSGDEWRALGTINSCDLELDVNSVKCIPDCKKRNDTVSTVEAPKIRRWRIRIVRCAMAAAVAPLAVLPMAMLLILGLLYAMVSGIGTFLPLRAARTIVWAALNAVFSVLVAVEDAIWGDLA
ncbi:hypothetical protein [Paraburkholderia sp. GAS334]|uniref:hypothetical protein n=1 Tax=Paraburkholderia sp. GAS334 TaxID=3035131 RepID=UPI003D1BEB73